jgi:hypothetical protein
MKSRILFLLLFIVSSVSVAEEIISPDITGLFEAPVIITGNGVINHSTGQIQFTIKHVLKNTSDEVLNLGGEVTFFEPNSCGFTLPDAHVNGKEMLVYLIEYQGKWHVHGGTQHFRLIDNNKLPFELCQKTYYYTPEEFIRMKTHFFLTFKKTGDLAFAPIMPKEEYEKSFSPFDCILRFYGCLYTNYSWPYEETEIPESQIYLEDTTIYKFTEIEPSFPGGKVEMMYYISERIPDSLLKVEGSIRGNVYIQFIVEKEGSLNQLKVLRGFEPRLDKVAVEIVKTMPKWIPGKQRGKAVRCNYIIPVRFTSR